MQAEQPQEIAVSIKVFHADGRVTDHGVVALDSPDAEKQTRFDELRQAGQPVSRATLGVAEPPGVAPHRGGEVTLFDFHPDDEDTTQHDSDTEEN